MTEQTASMGFTDERFPGSSHICLIYESDEQRRGLLVDYLAAGLAHGERVRYFADLTTPDTIRAWLAERGIAVRDAEARGAFSISSAEAAYCAGGRFDPAAMIAACKQGYVSADEAGFTGSRACGEMSWALRGRPGSERFLEYEALLNGVKVSFPHVGMCQYDARLFDGATLFKVLQVHPFMVAQGQIVRNPYYARPEELA